MQKVFIETRLEDEDLTKLNHTAIQVLGIYGTRKSKPRVKGELLKQQYTVTFLDCNYLAHVIALWQMQKLCVTVQLMLCFILNLRAISKYKSPGAYIWRGDLTKGYFALRGLGGCICGGAYFRNFTVCQKLPTVIEHLQWNLDITKAKGTGKYVRYTEDFVI